MRDVGVVEFRQRLPLAAQSREQSGARDATNDFDCRHLAKTGVSAVCQPHTAHSTLAHFPFQRPRTYGFSGDKAGSPLLGKI